MPKKSLTSEELYRLRSALQVSTITALMASRKWALGDIAFQGGTCLSLVHGSERFSEDLDFMIRGGMPLAGLEKSIERLLDLPRDIPAGLKPSVSLAKDDRNPHAFTVTLSGDGYIGSAKVKVELWRTPEAAMGQLQLLVRPIVSSTGAQAFVPAETLEEILADKVYALGARDRIKPRDFFDVWWIERKQRGIQLEAEKLLLRLSIYPRGDEAETAATWVAAAKDRLAMMTGTRAEGVAAMVEDDLRKWLPSFSGLNRQQAQEMVACAHHWLEAGLQIMVQGYAEAPAGPPEDGAIDRHRERG